MNSTASGKALCAIVVCAIILSMLGSLPNVVRAASAFNIGDTVRVTTNLNVRTGPSTSNPEITDPDYPGNAPAGTQGKVLDGPTSADGYVWWKVDYGPGLYSGWSVEGGLEKVIQPPPAPVITSPGSASEAGPVLSTLTPTLQWNAVSGAGVDYYALAISKYPYGSGNIIYNPQQLTGTSHVVPGGTLVAGEKYRWNMQAHNSAGWSAVSNTLYFQTQTTTYTLTVSIQGQGTVSPSGGSYASGTQVTLTATPASGWQFSNWSGGLTGSQNPATITMNSNKNITATFTQQSTPLSFTSLTPGTISTSQSTYVATLSAVGTNFNNVNQITVSWSGPDSGSQTWNKGDSNWNAAVTVNSDTSMTLLVRVLSNETGTQTKTWTWTVTLKDTASATASKSFTVTYTPAGPYTLTVSIQGQGTVSPSGGSYASGTQVTLTATPASGWQFSNWSGGLTGSQNPATITMNSNKNITATFAQQATPPAPVITSPGSASEAGPVLSTLTPTLQWNAVSGAGVDYYALAISKYPYGSGNIIYNPQQLTGTSHVVPGGTLVAGEKYRWNMQAHNIAGWSAVSNTLYFQTIAQDNPPIVNSLTVSPSSVTVGNSFAVSYSVSDDKGLDRVELWRANDSNGSPADWVEITRTSTSGNSDSGSFHDAPSSAGFYWYGIHVVDNAGSWNDERNSHTGSSPGVYGPIMVEVKQAQETISTPNTPTGPSSGQANHGLTYSTGGANSNLGHNLEYRFDWGGGSLSGWSSSTSASHSWSTGGSYTVKAQAMCATHTDVLSAWSAGLTVEIVEESTLTGSLQGTIAFRRDANGSSEIAVINPNGSGLSSLSQQGSAPTWSPDGAKIAFVSNHDIYVMNADGTGVVQITETSEWEIDPAWSPDGSKIAFARMPALWQEPADVWVMNADGSGQTQLTNHPAEDRMPSWSPDGTKIAFISHREGGGDVWVMNANGSGQTNLIDDSAWEFIDENPAWSPDGSKIAFIADREKRGGRDIYTINTDGSNIIRLTTPVGDNAHPTWSPDGANIAFASNREGSYDIYIMNADGTAETRLTSDSVSESGPSWGSGAGGVPATEPDIGEVSPIDFGSVLVDNSLDKTTTIFNGGDAKLTVHAITRTSGSSDFAYIVPSTPFEVAAGGSRTVTIRFSPGSEGAKNAIFTISSDDLDEASVTFAVSGTGTKKKPPAAYIDSLSPNPAIQDKDTISFAGHGTDTDGSVVAYDWRSSLDGQLSTLNSFNMLASELSVGTHTIYFKVQDNDGLWSPEATQELTVNAEHMLTIVAGPEAEPPAVSSSGTTQLSVSATDSLDHAISYEWTATGGSFDNANLQKPTWYAPRNTTSSTVYYTLTVTVTCTEGKTAVGDVQVGVKPEEEVAVSIDDHSAEPKEVKVDESTILSFSFTNIGNLPWTFYAAVSLRKPDGTEEHLWLKPVSLTPGEQGSATWSYAVDAEGGWDIVFGVWKEQGQVNSLDYTGWLDDYVVGVPPPSAAQFTLSISHNPNGTVRVSPSGEDPAGRPTLSLSDETGEVKESLRYYNAGAKVTLTAEPVPGSGYRFSRWGGDLAGSKSTGTITVESDVQVIAHFVPESLVGVVQVANLEGDELAMVGRIMMKTIEWLSIGETDSKHKDWLASARGLAKKVESRENVENAIKLSESRQLFVDVMAAIGGALGQWATGGVVPQHIGTAALKLAGEITKMTTEKLVLSGRGVVEVENLEEPSIGTLYAIYERTEGKVTVHVDLFDPPGRVLMVIPLEPILADSAGAGNIVILKDMVPDLDKVWRDYPEVHMTKIIVKSPVELRVYDSDRRVTGIINGQVRKEIPSSSYSKGVVVILSPTELPLDTYDYEIQGIERGTYGLEVKSVRGEATNVVSRDNVAVSTGVVHKYTIDWDTLAEGGKGVTMKVDSDGDGTFEETKHFSQEEGGFPWVWLVAAISSLVGVLLGAFIVRRRVSREKTA